MSGEPCAYLEWDSAFFGHRIARVNGTRVDEKRMSEILDWCQGRAIDCLYLLAEPDDPSTILAAEGEAFHLVDVRVTFEWRAAAVAGRTASGVVVQAARAADVEALEVIAARAHEGSRFYADARLAGRASSLYRTWIARSVTGYADAVWVAEVEGRVAGYLSCHLERDEARIGLVGVDLGVQRQGIGRALVEGAQAWSVARGAARVVVATQGWNIAAQRLYQRCGFVTERVQLWYHKWFEPAERASAGRSP